MRQNRERPDLAALAARGRVKLDDQVRAAIVRQIINEHLPVRWFNTPQIRPDFEAVGVVVGVVEAGDVVFHLISEHGGDFIRIVLGD